MRILYFNIIQSGYLGTSVQVEVIFNEEPTAVEITFYDPSENVMGKESGEDLDMTRETAHVWSYNYQSSTADDWGTYYATIEATTSDGRTLVFEKQFEMLESKLS